MLKNAARETGPSQGRDRKGNYTKTQRKGTHYKPRHGICFLTINARQKIEGVKKKNKGYLNTSGAKTPAAARSVLKHIHLDGVGIADLLQDELRNTIARRYLEIDQAEVEDDDPDNAAVIGVDDTAADVDTMPQRETRTRSYAPIAPQGNPDLEAGRNAGARPRGDDDRLGGAKVKPSGTGGASDRSFGAITLQNEAKRRTQTPSRGRGRGWILEGRRRRERHSLVTK